MMNKLLPLLCLTALPLSAFDLPKSFFEITKLDEARAEASEKPKAVGFLITKPEMQPT